jgi:two-component system chemotaxis response regulator CheY
MSRARVLVVDSIADEREMYVEGLQAEGFTVTISDPSAALALVSTHAVDVILARVTQPHQAIDGIELTRRTKTAANGIPVVLVTTRIEPAYRRAAGRAGCDAFVMLPATPTEIADILRSALARERGPHFQVRRHGRHHERNLPS